MAENTDLERLNPRITEIDIGIRNMRKIKIYPLSIYDQKKFVEKLKVAITAFFSGDQKGDLEFALFVIELIEKNIDTILEMVSDMKKSDIKDALKDIDNFQIADIARTIYEKNFEDSSKNLGGLREIIAKMVSPSIPQRPSPQLRRDTALTSAESSAQASEMAG